MSELEPSSTRVGTTLRGKWTLERLLGEGGMASVYVARHKIGRLDAIKILHPAIAATPQLRARFEQEAHVVNRFRHAGAVEIRDIDTSEDGAPFLVMELLEGETLSSLVRRSGGALDAAIVLRVADQVLDVLAAAHAHGIIHRDIKPDNLMFLPDGRVKVLDFGIARVRERVNEDLKTRTGTTLGTVSYMPPEQAKGLEIDARADVYAVGATMFRLLASRRVHEADTEVERLMKVVTEPAPPLASIAPQVPSAVCAVVDRALAFHRDQRYPDASAMQADVRGVMRGDQPAPAPRGAAVPLAAAAEAIPTRAEAPTVGPAARPHPRPDEAPTRAGPALAPEAATVAAPAPTSPAMFPTAPTAPIAPPPAAAPLAPAPPPAAAAPKNKALVVALAAGGAVLLLASIAVAGALFWSTRAAPSPDAPAIALSSEPESADSSALPQPTPPPPMHAAASPTHAVAAVPGTATADAPRPEPASPPRSAPSPEPAPQTAPQPAPRSTQAAPQPEPQPAPAPQPPSAPQATAASQPAPQPPPAPQPTPGHGHGHGHGHGR